MFGSLNYLKSPQNPLTTLTILHPAHFSLNTSTQENYAVVF